MWREYSSGYLKNNRAAAAAVMTAALISSLLLSLLGCLFYNMWKYEVERISLNEGGWQSRLVGGDRMGRPWKPSEISPLWKRPW